MKTSAMTNFKDTLVKQIICLIFLTFMSGCFDNSKTKIWVYTSTYKEVLALYDPLLKKAFPDIQVEWYQAGSETVASKILTEKSSGGIQADILMTSDLFFFNELSKEKVFLPLFVPETYQVPAKNISTDKSYSISRFPVMVIGYNNTLVQGEAIPKSWSDLLKPHFKSTISMPSPLESGSTLTGLFFLKEILDPDFFSKLRSQNILASGGNGSTLSRLLSGEKQVGIILMENILQAQEKGQSQVSFVIPEEGALPIPSPVGVFASSKSPETAQKIAKWFFSPEAQETLVKGWVYSTNPSAKPPQGAPEWKSLKLRDWSLDQFARWTEQRQKLKDDFQKIVLQ